MDTGDFDRFRPHWTDAFGASEHISSLREIHESIAAAVVGTRRITEHMFSEPKDELTLAGERLASGLTHLRQAITAFAGRAKKHAESAEPGFDETKLLASIEKWQRRYQALEGEYAAVEARLLRMEEAQGQALLRTERAIDAIDAVLEEAGNYGETR